MERQNPINRPLPQQESIENILNLLDANDKIIKTKRQTSYASISGSLIHVVINSALDDKRLYLKEKYCKQKAIPFKSKNRFAAELIKAFRPPVKLSVDMIFTGDIE